MLNLCASGELLSILQVISISTQATIVEVFKQELQEIENIEQFESAIEQGLLLIVYLESGAERTAFVNYAVDIDDSNRMCQFFSTNNIAVKTISKELNIRICLG